MKALQFLALMTITYMDVHAISYNRQENSNLTNVPKANNYSVKNEVKLRPATSVLNTRVTLRPIFKASNYENRTHLRFPHADNSGFSWLLKRGAHKWAKMNNHPLHIDYRGKAVYQNSTTPSTTQPTSFPFAGRSRRQGISSSAPSALVNDDPRYAALEDKSILNDLPRTTTREAPIASSAALGLSKENLLDLRADVDHYYMQGYDCRKPLSITAVSSHVADPCVQPLPHATKVEASAPKVWQVLQIEKTRTVKGHRCKVTKSAQTFYCGNADHATPWPQDTYHNRVESVPIEVCRNMVRTNTYKTEDHQVRQVAKGTLNRFNYYRVGNAYPSNDWQGNQVSCTGGALALNGVVIKSMVQYFTEEVLYEEEKFVLREDDSVVAFYKNLRLSCPFDDKGCLGSGHTFIWTIPQRDHCPLGLVKTFTGALLTSDTKSQKVAVSTDKSLLRFVLKGNMEYCKRHVTRTNYDNIVLYEANNPDGSRKRDLFKRELPPGSVSLSLFVVNRDDVLYHKLLQQVREEYSAVVADDCRAELEKTKLNHFLEREIPGYRSYRLGGSNYVTAAGEVIYTFKCKPTLVQALESDFCYDALPIRMVKETDHVKFTKVDGTENEAPKHFLEPLTHRITSTAAKVPCVAKFFARYKDYFGRWFVITPRLKTVDAPDKLSVELLHRQANFSAFEETDFSQGGLYSTDEIDSLQNYLEMGRIQNAITIKLAEQATQLRPEDYLSPGMLFPPHAIPGGSWSTFIMGKVWGWIRSLGEFASIGLAILIIVRTTWYLIKVIVNCKLLYGVHGLSLGLGWAFCTEVLFAHHYRRSNHRGRLNPMGRQDPNQSRQRGFLDDCFRNACDCNKSDSEDEQEMSPLSGNPEETKPTRTSSSSGNIGHAPQRPAPILEAGSSSTLGTTGYAPNPAAAAAHTRSRYQTLTGRLATSTSSRIPDQITYPSYSSRPADPESPPGYGEADTGNSDANVNSYVNYP